jgi:two-component system OmpR family sensor kinase
MTLQAHSIRATLLLWLAGGLTLAISLVAVALYLQARAEANQLFDYQMEQVATALPSRFLASVPPGEANPFEATPNVVIQIWDPTGVRVYFSHDYADLPQRAVLGFSTIEVHDQQWRVYSAQQGPTVVQIAQPMQVRSAMAARSALKTVAPLLLLVPFLGGLIWIAVGRGLAPIHEIAAQLAARDVGQLAPVSGVGLPDEIRPLTDAVNDLLARLDQAAGAQRIFIDDAAHELRTPLTALQLQVSLAERAADDGARKAAFDALHAGLARASRLVQQLLTLARHEPGAATHVWQRVDLAALAREAVGALAPAADARQIDLGFAGTQVVPVNADPDALRILISNLIDNALRASPVGGRIDVAVRGDGDTATLTVDDEGPGVPSEELTRVFDRFYRGSGAPSGGSGLGLAIVRRIADLHRAQVSLANTGKGLRASVAMPLASDTPIGAARSV